MGVLHQECICPSLPIRRISVVAELVSGRWLVAWIAGWRYRLVVASRRMVVRAEFPGAELVEKGLADLAEGAETVESLLVSVGAPRLRDLGFPVRAPFEDPEERLYLLLASGDAGGAHSRYNALVRRLVSFERAAESAR